jgi:hypothetical protein
MSNLLTNRRIIFRPLGLPNFSGLALWLDAADTSTITLDGSNNVSEWRDKSGNARHATQATSGSRPGYAADAVNGKSSIVYSDGKFLVTPAFDVASNPGWTILTAHRITGAANTRRLYSWNNHIRILGLISTDRIVVDFHPTLDGNIGGGRFLTASADMASTAWRYSAQYLSTSERAYIFGRPGTELAETSGVLPSAYSATSSVFSVGRDVPNNATLNGSYGEVIVYSRALTSGERAQALAYLAAKWKIV